MNQNTQADFFLPDSLIEQAIEDFVYEAQRALDIHLAIPVRQRTADDRAAITQLRRDIKAYERVGDYCAAGLYPRAIDALWEVGSLSEPGTQHHIWREENKWVCDCKCADRGYFHVHQAMMAVIERAMDLAEQHGYEPEVEIDEDPFLPDAPAALGRRLAAARAEYLKAA